MLFLANSKLNSCQSYSHLGPWSDVLNLAKQQDRRNMGLGYNGVTMPAL